MVIYFMEFSYLKFPFFSRQTKFQQCIFRRMNWILTSLGGPIKIPYNRWVYVEVHYAIVECKNGKAKSAYYLVQIVDFDDPNDCSRMISKTTRISYWSYFSKSHRFLQYLSSKLGINWTRNNVNTLQGHYFRLS